MSTLFCKWPAADQAEAVNYNDVCGLNHPEGPEAIWANVRQDTNDNWTVPLMGPPWSFDGINPFAEPSACLAAREDAVVVENPEWPEPEE